MAQTNLQPLRPSDDDALESAFREFASLSSFDPEDQVRRLEIATNLLSTPVNEYEAAFAKRVCLIADDLYFSLSAQRSLPDSVAAAATVALIGFLLGNKNGSKARHLLHTVEDALHRLLPGDPKLHVLHAKILAAGCRFAEASALLDPLLCGADRPNEQVLAQGLFLLRAQQRDRELKALSDRYPAEDQVRWTNTLLEFQHGGPAAALSAALRKEVFEATPERKLKAWLYTVAAGNTIVVDLLQSPQNVKRHHVRPKSSPIDLVLLADAAQLVETWRTDPERDPYLAYENFRIDLAECTDPEVALLFDAATAAVCSTRWPSVSKLARHAYEAKSLLLLNGSHRDALMLTVLFATQSTKDDAKSGKPSRKSTALLPGVTYQNALSGSIARQASLLGSAAKVASVVLADRLRHVVTLGQRHRSSRDEVLTACAEVIAKDLAKYRGGLQKLVQIGAGLEAIVPEAVRTQLNQAATNSFPITPDRVRALVSAELGQEVGTAFRTFDDQPIASGSIAQVHRATAPSGEALAVKVQIPKIETMIAADFKGLGRLSWFLSGVLPISHAELNDLIKAWAEFTMAECDFELERRNLIVAGGLFKGDPHIRIPALAPGLQSPRILVTEFANGQSFEDFLRTSTEQSRQRAGVSLMRFVLRGLRHGFLKYDLDPSNFRFNDSELWTLDFAGLAPYEWSGSQNLLQVIQSLQKGNSEGLKAYMQGMVVRPETYEFSKELKLHQDVLLRPFLVEGAFRFTTEFARRVFFAMTVDHPNLGSVAVKPWWMPYTRFYWTLYSMLGRLEAEANWGQIAAEEAA